MKAARVLRSDEVKVQQADWGELTWFASRELHNAAVLTFGRCVIRAGRANPRHSHPNCEEVLHLLRGRIAHSLGDGEVELAEGDTITVPVGVVHNARNVGTGDAVMMIAFSSADRQVNGE